MGGGWEIPGPSYWVRETSRVLALGVSELQGLLPVTL